jgi:uncharacterized protein (TIGR00255 family)
MFTFQEYWFVIKSMTGFGRGRYEGERFACAAEIRSVNHRFLDIHVRLPLELASFELKVKKLVQSRIKRGRLDVTVTLEQSQVPNVTLNRALLEAYLGAMEKLRMEYGLSGEIDFVQLLRIPGVLNLEALGVREEAMSGLEETIGYATQAAVENLEQMRVEEGQQLRSDILSRLGLIQEKVAVISQLMQGTLEAYQDRLRARLTELLRGVSLDPNRLAQEAALYVERSDITEEITRLHSHTNQFGEMIGIGEEVGKTLDFLLQEMNREANTILSKTTGITGNGLEISTAAICIKTEVEKIREQIQNVE